MSIEEFRQLQAEMPDEELVKIATEELSKMCHSGGNSFHMSVPYMYKSKIELQKSNKPRQPNLRKCNVISRFFLPYKPFKIKKYNWWFNFYQGSINIKNVFSIRWKWICDNWSKETEFALNIFRFVFPFLYRSRALFSLHFYTWDKRPAMYLTVEFLFLPSLDFRIGDGKTWFWIRNENWYAYKIRKQNKKITF